MQGSVSVKVIAKSSISGTVSSELFVGAADSVVVATLQDKLIPQPCCWVPYRGVQSLAKFESLIIFRPFLIPSRPRVRFFSADALEWVLGSGEEFPVEGFFSLALANQTLPPESIALCPTIELTCNLPPIPGFVALNAIPYCIRSTSPNPVPGGARVFISLGTTPNYLRFPPYGVKACHPLYVVRRLTEITKKKTSPPNLMDTYILKLTHVCPLPLDRRPLYA